MAHGITTGDGAAPAGRRVDIDPGAGWAYALLRDRPVAAQAATDAPHRRGGRTGRFGSPPSPGQGEVPVH
jgi:hypothetical protein